MDELSKHQKMMCDRETMLFILCTLILVVVLIIILTWMHKPYTEKTVIKIHVNITQTPEAQWRLQPQYSTLSADQEGSKSSTDRFSCDVMLDTTPSVTTTNSSTDSDSDTNSAYYPDAPPPSPSASSTDSMTWV